MKIFIRNHRNNLIKNREQSFFYRAHSGHSMGHFWLIHLPVDLFHHHIKHGLGTTNEGINQRYLKYWAYVAEIICFGRT